MTALLVLGGSSSAVCGVRDCAVALEPALRDAGADVETVWWERARGEDVRAWAARAAAASARADAVLWHYSVFTYAVRGVPLPLAPALHGLRRVRPPVVGLLHELVYPWGRDGARGAVFASTQRVALAALLRPLAGVLVTTEERAAWLGSRRWLPRRPVGFVPVVSNVPPAAGRAGANGAFRVGVFGFRRDGLAPEGVVTDALARLSDRGVDASLRLVGAPGPESDEAARWRRAAGTAGCALSFSGVLAPEPLSAELAALDAVVFPDDCGPTSRRGTLAAALAHGRPVVAFDGPQRWRALVESGAVVLTRRDPEALAAALEVLARDPTVRCVQAERAAAFYDGAMAPAVVAPRILDFCRRVAA